jgi:hypothetical protein
MGRPKIFESEAEKQRVYRLRRKIAKQGVEAVHYARLQELHHVVKRAALDGNEAAAKLLGNSPSDTALRVIISTQPPEAYEDNGYLPVDLFGFDFAYYAYEQAASTVVLERTGAKDGVFQVVVGAPAPATRKGKSVADRPTATSSAKRNVTKKNRTRRAKKPLKVSTVPA